MSLKRAVAAVVLLVVLFVGRELLLDNFADDTDSLRSSVAAVWDSFLGGLLGDIFARRSPRTRAAPAGMRSRGGASRKRRRIRVTGVRRLRQSRDR